MEEIEKIKCLACNFRLDIIENIVLFEFLEDTGECPECGKPLYYGDDTRVVAENYQITAERLPSEEPSKTDDND
jgi:predicted RNA-binding Zn-ribbon protein involved in translation (DUF1610 family)